jgi:hypothetical protein
MATSDSPVAIVPVNAVLRTLTALSHGSLPVDCAYTGSAVSKSSEGVSHLRQCAHNAVKRWRGRFVMNVSMCSFHLRLGEGHSPFAMSGAKVGRIGRSVVCRFRGGVCRSCTPPGNKQNTQQTCGCQENCAGLARIEAGSGRKLEEGHGDRLCRMHRPPHSRDGQQKTCGTAWVKAVTSQCGNSARLEARRHARIMNRTRE